MASTLIAVVLALVLGHAFHALAALRDFTWYRAWLRWLGARLGDTAHADARAAGWPLLLAALAPPLLLVALLQLGLRDAGWGLPAFVFALLALFYCWGPRDLDRDVEALVEDSAADDAGTRRAAAVAALLPPGASATAPAALVVAVFRGALRRWFGVLLWFLLLGPVGALLYRLAAIGTESDARAAQSPDTSAAADTLLAVLDWPAAQLMTFALALVANFDGVFGAWREWARGGWRLDLGFLDAAARVSVASELAEEQGELGDGGEATLAGMPGSVELRDAMSLIWRMLLLWLAVLSLFVLAGWVG